MDTDLLLYGVYGLLLVLIGLFGALLLGIRQIPRILQTQARKMIEGFLWVESEEVVEGKKQWVKRPNPQIVAAAEAMAPIFIAAGLDWAKKNIKLGAPGSGGAGLGGLGGALGGMLPAKFRAFGPLLEPLLAKFLGGMGGKPAESTTALPTNPFAK
jgi:hypothetical protein